MAKWHAPEGWLTIKQAAEALDVSEKTVRRKITSREISAQKVDSPFGEAWVVKETEINTARQVVDVVAVQRQHEIKDLALALTQFFSEREEKLSEEIRRLTQQVNILSESLVEKEQKEIARVQEIEKRLQERDEKIIESINFWRTQMDEPKKGFFSRLFGK